MASINYATREISCKIVYYGPGLSGKTTNLQIIHKKIPEKDKSEMVSLATETDRTLFFDFLPLDLGSIKGFSTKFQLYTVPGQVYYNATRKLVLRGVDGVVFVVDSQPDKVNDNLESFANLEENLREYGHSHETIPFVLQYNKRDIPGVLSIEDLNRLVNKYNLPFFEAVAASGVGVFTTLKGIGKAVIDKFNSKYAGFQGQRRPAAPQRPMAPIGQTSTPTPPTSAPMMPGQRAVYPPPTGNFQIPTPSTPLQPAPFSAPAPRAPFNPAQPPLATPPPLTPKPGFIPPSPTAPAKTFSSPPSFAPTPSSSGPQFFQTPHTGSPMPQQPGGFNPATGSFPITPPGPNPPPQSKPGPFQTPTGFQAASGFNPIKGGVPTSPPLQSSGGPAAHPGQPFQAPEPNQGLNRIPTSPFLDAFPSNSPSDKPFAPPTIPLPQGGFGNSAFESPFGMPSSTPMGNPGLPPAAPGRENVNPFQGYSTPDPNAADPNPPEDKKKGFLGGLFGKGK